MVFFFLEHCIWFFHVSNIKKNSIKKLVSIVASELIASFMTITRWLIELRLEFHYPFYLFTRFNPRKLNLFPHRNVPPAEKKFQRKKGLLSNDDNFTLVCNKRYKILSTNTEKKVHQLFFTLRLSEKMH